MPHAKQERIGGWLPESLPLASRSQIQEALQSCAASIFLDLAQSPCSAAEAHKSKQSAFDWHFIVSHMSVWDNALSVGIIAVYQQHDL